MIVDDHVYFTSGIRGNEHSSFRIEGYPDWPEATVWADRVVGISEDVSDRSSAVSCRYWLSVGKGNARDFVSDWIVSVPEDVRQIERGRFRTRTR